MITANGIKGNYLEYQGMPLVRKGDEIYLGDLSDKSYIFMVIMDTEKKFDVEIPTKILVQLLDSKDKKPVRDKQKWATNLSQAFEYGTAWLKSYNR